MFKYETHLHTAEASACASAKGEEQARRYKELGYDGIIVTDHFFNGNTCVREYTGWDDRVTKFCAGYRNAKAEGDRIGLKVFLGWEYCYEGADLLTYGLDEQWLHDNPDVLELSVFDYCDRVHRDGGYIVHAHPFREAGYLREIRLIPMWIDAVEIHNCGNARQEMNDRAKWFAEQYDKPVTGGTDNHHLTAFPISGIASEEPFETIQELCRGIAERRVTPIIPQE
ncbi:MAG: histidinol-phosphatase [Ruminococcus sp.]|nr:histidinol-phosphatase [Ruminococcus sp.]